MSLFNSKEDDFDNKYSSINKISFDVVETLDGTCDNKPSNIEVQDESSSDSELFVNYSSYSDNALPARQYKNKKLYQTVTDKSSSTKLSTSESDHKCDEENIDICEDNARTSTFCTELLVNDDKLNTSSWELFTQLCEQKNIKSHSPFEGNENDCSFVNNFDRDTNPLPLDVKDKECFSNEIQSESTSEETIDYVLSYRFLGSYLEIKDEVKGTVERVYIPEENSTQLTESNQSPKVRELVPRDQSEKTSLSDTIKFKCEKCSSIFDDEIKCKEHFDLHFKSLECKKCNRHFKNVRYFERHLQNDICTKKKLRRRDNLKKLNEISKESVFKCHRCGLSSKSSNELEEHKKSHINEKIFFCHECPESFRFQKQLITHLLDHPFINNNECSFCSDMFGSSLSLNIHLRKCPSNVNEKYLCAICKKSFVTKRSLVSHLASIHSANRPFSCPFCEQKFAKKSILNTHIKTVHSQKTYKCVKCYKCFRTKHVLDRHKMIHRDVKPFKCNNCSLHFSLFFNLKRHLQIHTEEKQFTVEFVIKVFFKSSV